MLTHVKNNPKLQSIENLLKHAKTDSCKLITNFCTYVFFHRGLAKLFPAILPALLFSIFLETTVYSYPYISKKPAHKNFKISEIKKESFKDMLSRIDTYMREGRYIAATRLTRKAIIRFPGRNEVNPILATVMALGKQSSKAEFTLRRSSGISLKYSSYKYITKALIALERQDTEKSKKFAEQAIKVDPSNPLSYDTLGMVFLSNKRLSDAANFFRKAIRVEPKFSVGYSKLGAISLSTKRAWQAIKYYKIATKLNPENEKNLYGLAQAFLMSGNGDEGEKFLNKAIKQNKRFTPAYVMLSDIYFKAGKYSKSYAYGKKLLSVYPGKSEGAFITARALSQMGKVEEALKYANLVLKDNPEHIPSLNIQGYSYIALKKYDDALETFSKVASQGFLFPISYIHALHGKVSESEAILESVVQDKVFGKLAHFLLAQLAIMRGRDEEAVKHLKKSSGFISGFTVRNIDIKKYVRNNRSKRLEQFLCALYIFKKRFSRAEKLALDVSAKNPNDIIALYILGKLHNLTGGEGTKYFAKALKIEPDFISAHIELGVIYTNKKDYKKSVSNYKAIAETFSDRAEVQYNLGLRYYKAGHKQKAYDFFLDMLNEFPYFAPIYNQLALIAMDLQPKQAIKWARQAGELLPKSGQIQDTIGWIYLTEGDYKNGITFLKRALALTTNSPTIYYHLGMAYKKQGMREEAASLFTKAIALSKDFPEEESCKKEIK